MWESAYLTRVKKFPDLAGWLDPPRTRRLTPQQAADRRAEFLAAKQASDRVPVRPASKQHGRQDDPDGKANPSEHG